ncbi:hypothetical protein BD410DRAFT_441873 [Rickenella mellea]|uniref:Uncharacterized protein n=1 Tax=Rickenella mellea TaxID=50990 RepID=A0A4Y7PY26_9AGAM|nr:hypothetical protein BD410DRAFT_441873 [Rickenella mellea]
MVIGRLDHIHTVLKRYKSAPRNPISRNLLYNTAHPSPLFHINVRLYRQISSRMQKTLRRLAQLVMPLRLSTHHPRGISSTRSHSNFTPAVLAIRPHVSRHPVLPKPAILADLRGCSYTYHPLPIPPRNTCRCSRMVNHIIQCGATPCHVSHRPAAPYDPRFTG